MILISIYMLAVISVLYLVTSVLVARKVIFNYNKPNNQKLKQQPGVSILKPIKGIDDDLANNLISFFEQDYKNFELIFGFQDALDPAIPLVKRVMSGYNQINARIIVDNRNLGRNPKINNLLNMYPQINHSYILISDSNTRVNKNFLNTMMKTILEPGVGLVTATVRGVGIGSAASVMENLHLNTFIAPNVFLADKVARKPLAIGKSMLFHKSVLDQLGGFKSFKDFLGEDYLFGKWVTELGLKVRILPEFVDNINISWNFNRFLNRHTRWAKMRRHTHIGYYLGEPISNPVFLGLIILLNSLDVTGLLIFSLLSGFKLVHDFYMTSLLQQRLPVHYYGLGIIKDLIIGFIWTVPFFSYKVKWRGNKYRIYKNTFIQPAY
ncbi:MAG: glycosyltransferase [Calditrichaceae bacterium]|nr:glycosyltransferase [Calditrichaceae bacterium]MBN2709589.1 glycosyltransferase [Calditrichaceae bacterium]RQV92388.1 MAG: hypothetical protein EH224_15410 [Calditrichota bacterium]